MFQGNMEKFLTDFSVCFFEWAPFDSKLEKEFKDLIGAELATDPDLIEFQNNILDRTLKSKIGKRFPPSLDKTRKLFKRCVMILEDAGAEVMEEFYNAVVAHSKTSDDHQFRSYFQDGEYLLSLAERTEAICEGTTGLATWTGAKSLARWLQNQPPHLLDGHVLELGSGAGYTGIALAKLGRISDKLTLTDHHRLVLEALAKNVELNLTENWSVKEGSDFLLDKVFLSSSGSSVVVEHLDWQLFNRHNAELLNPDVIIGADIIFDEDLLPALVDTIHLCLTVGNVRERHAYIAGVVRKEATSSAFVRQVQLKGMKVEIKVLDKSPLIYLYTISV
jgi:hypothetical protein